MNRHAAAELLRHTCAEVAPGLWLGGDAAAVPDQVTTVVTLEATTPAVTATGVVEHRCHFADSRWQPVDRTPLDAAIEAVTFATGPTLVRCRHGLNRSALTVCLALRRDGKAAAEALHLVTARRPGALTNPYFAALIRTYPNEPR